MMIGHLEESHEEEELENSEDREVKVQVDWHPVPHYLINICLLESSFKIFDQFKNLPVGWVLGWVDVQRVVHVQLLSSDQAKYEEDISSQGDNLRIKQ